MLAPAASPEAEIIVALVRGILAAVLLLAATTKVRDRGSFSAVLVFLAPWVRRSWVSPLAAGITAIEGSLAFLLVVGTMIGPVLVGVTGFLLAATLALRILRRRGYEGGCACFGELAAARQVGLTDLARNGVLMTAASGILVLIVTDHAGAPPLWSYSTGEIATGTTLTAGLLLCYAMIDAIVTVRLAARRGFASGGHTARDTA